MNKLIKRIKNILVGDKQPKDKYSLWLDTSEGEANAVLKYKGHPIAGSGDSESSDPGYNVTKSYNTYLEQQDITTEFSNLSGDARSGEYTTDALLVAGNIYKVIFDGVEYYCTAYNMRENYNVLGAPFIGPSYDFSKYPFNIGTFDYGDNQISYCLITPEAGTYLVKVEEVTMQVTTSNEFEAAVNSVNNQLPSLKVANLVLNDTDNVDWTQGFKIYYQNTCIYDSDNLGVSISVESDQNSWSAQVSSGGMVVIPRELHNIDVITFFEKYLYKTVEKQNRLMFSCVESLWNPFAIQITEIRFYVEYFM